MNAMVQESWRRDPVEITIDGNQCAFKGDETKGKNGCALDFDRLERK